MSQVILGHKTLKFIKGYYYAPFDITPKLNELLENIISGTDEPLNQNILNQIDKSGQDFTDINNQLKEIILGGLEPIEHPENYLTFEAVSYTIRISFSNNCQYSLGTNEWFDLEPGGFTPIIKKGQKIYFKATGLTPEEDVGIGTFTIIGNCNLLGNCNSMMFGDDAETNLSLSGKDYAFYKLFYNCSTIIDASQLILPATILSKHCYNGMFWNCTSLVTPPELPATTLANYCYNNMFWNCTSLVTPPELPATTLANYCYQYIFRDCTSLVSAPTLHATTLAIYCYAGMFDDCASLVAAPALPATSLAKYCYIGMFSGCTSLVTAPELPATVLADSCYSQMFDGCTSLVTAPELPATILETGCYDFMFRDCTSLVTAPELPATTLITNCYQYMFDGCTKLNYIKALFTTTTSGAAGPPYTSYWVRGVSSTGTFVKSKNATWNITGEHGIPSGWTVQTV